MVAKVKLWSQEQMNESSRNVSLGAFQRKINSYRIRIGNALLAELNQRKNSVFYEPLLKALKGGKRVRPILLLLSFENIGKQKIDPLPAAVAVELAHTESLIHDDIIDRDYFRRETATFHASYGREMALLSADFILSLILDITARSVDSRIPKVLALATSEMCEGELAELAAYKNGEKLHEDAYINIISKKTASLFEASTAIGAIIGGAEKDEVQALSDYGRFLGTSYQIQDDIADLEKTTTVNIQKLVDLNLGKIQSFQEISDSYVRKAKEKLERLPMNEAKTLLTQLADLTMSSAINRI
jgi:octaprenyl-diphosphate synthase